MFGIADAVAIPRGVHTAALHYRPRLWFAQGVDYCAKVHHSSLDAKQPFHVVMLYTVGLHLAMGLRVRAEKPRLREYCACRPKSYSCGALFYLRCFGRLNTRALKPCTCVCGDHVPKSRATLWFKPSHGKARGREQNIAVPSSASVRIED